MRNNKRRVSKKHSLKYEYINEDLISGLYENENITNNSNNTNNCNGCNNKSVLNNCYINIAKTLQITYRIVRNIFNSVIQKTIFTIFIVLVNLTRLVNFILLLVQLLITIITGVINPLNSINLYFLYKSHYEDIIFINKEFIHNINQPNDNEYALEFRHNRSNINDNDRNDVNNSIYPAFLLVFKVLLFNLKASFKYLLYYIPFILLTSIINIFIIIGILGNMLFVLWRFPLIIKVFLVDYNWSKLTSYYYNINNKEKNRSNINSTPNITKANTKSSIVFKYISNNFKFFIIDAIHFNTLVEIIKVVIYDYILIFKILFVFLNLYRGIYFFLFQLKFCSKKKKNLFLKHSKLGNSSRMIKSVSNNTVNFQSPIKAKSKHYAKDQLLYSEGNNLKQEKKSSKLNSENSISYTLYDSTIELSKLNRLEEYPNTKTHSDLNYQEYKGIEKSSSYNVQEIIEEKINTNNTYNTCNTYNTSSNNNDKDSKKENRDYNYDTPTHNINIINKNKSGNNVNNFIFDKLNYWEKSKLKRKNTITSLRRRHKSSDSLDDIITPKEMLLTYESIIKSGSFNSLIRPNSKEMLNTNNTTHINYDNTTIKTNKTYNIIDSNSLFIIINNIFNSSIPHTEFLALNSTINIINRHIYHMTVNLEIVLLPFMYLFSLIFPHRLLQLSLIFKQNSIKDKISELLYLFYLGFEDYFILVFTLILLLSGICTYEISLLIYYTIKKNFLKSSLSVLLYNLYYTKNFKEEIFKIARKQISLLFAFILLIINFLFFVRVYSLVFRLNSLLNAKLSGDYKLFISFINYQLKKDKIKEITTNFGYSLIKEMRRNIKEIENEESSNFINIKKRNHIDSTNFSKLKKNILSRFNWNRNVKSNIKISTNLNKDSKTIKGDKTSKENKENKNSYISIVHRTSSNNNNNNISSISNSNKDDNNKNELQLISNNNSNYSLKGNGKAKARIKRSYSFDNMTYKHNIQNPDKLKHLKEAEKNKRLKQTKIQYSEIELSNIKVPFDFVIKISSYLKPHDIEAFSLSCSSIYLLLSVNKVWEIQYNYLLNKNTNQLNQIEINKHNNEVHKDHKTLSTSNVVRNNKSTNKSTISFLKVALENSKSMAFKEKCKILFPYINYNNRNISQSEIDNIIGFTGIVFEESIYTYTEFSHIFMFPIKFISHLLDIVGKISFFAYIYFIESDDYFSDIEVYYSNDSDITNINYYSNDITEINDVIKLTLDVSKLKRISQIDTLYKLIYQFENYVRSDFWYYNIQVIGVIGIIELIIFLISAIIHFYFKFTILLIEVILRRSRSQMFSETEYMGLIYHENNEFKNNIAKDKPDNNGNHRNNISNHVLNDNMQNGYKISLINNSRNTGKARIKDFTENNIINTSTLNNIDNISLNSVTSLSEMSSLKNHNNIPDNKYENEEKDNLTIDNNVIDVSTIILSNNEISENINNNISNKNKDTNKENQTTENKLNMEISKFYNDDTSKLNRYKLLTNNKNENNYMPKNTNIKTNNEFYSSKYYHKRNTINFSNQKLFHNNLNRHQYNNISNIMNSFDSYTNTNNSLYTNNNINNKEIIHNKKIMKNPHKRKSMFTLKDNYHTKSSKSLKTYNFKEKLEEISCSSLLIQLFISLYFLTLYLLVIISPILICFYNDINLIINTIIYYFKEKQLSFIIVNSPFSKSFFNLVVSFLNNIPSSLLIVILVSILLIYLLVMFIINRFKLIFSYSKSVIIFDFLYMFLSLTKEGYSSFLFWKLFPIIFFPQTFLSVYVIQKLKVEDFSLRQLIMFYTIYIFIALHPLCFFTIIKLGLLRIFFLSCYFICNMMITLKLLLNYIYLGDEVRFKGYKGAKKFF